MGSNVVRYKVPSAAASGAQTFSDSLVGQQITDGTSQLTNTNFALDKVIVEKDNKNFKTSPFSDFLTLDKLKIETDIPSTTDGSIEIYGIMGNLVYTSVINKGTSELQLNVKGINSGLYFYTIRVDNKINSGKITIINN